MNRYWVSWYSGNYEDEGCTAPPYTFCVTGQRSRPDDGLSVENQVIAAKIMDSDEYDEFLDKHSRDDCTICAVIDAEDEQAVWTQVAPYFPDYTQRFVEVRAADYQPGERFQ